MLTARTRTSCVTLCKADLILIPRGSAFDIHRINPSRRSTCILHYSIFDVAFPQPTSVSLAVLVEGLSKQIQRQHRCSSAFQTPSQVYQFVNHGPWSSYSGRDQLKVAPTRHSTYQFPGRRSTLTRSSTACACRSEIRLTWSELQGEAENEKQWAQQHITGMLISQQFETVISRMVASSASIRVQGGQDLNLLAEPRGAFRGWERTRKHQSRGFMHDRDISMDIYASLSPG